MAGQDSAKSTLSADDELARRLCALAVTFSNAKAPIASRTIREAHYPELVGESFHRKFARDRERLAESGLVVRQVGSYDKEALWQADPASFADGGTVTPEDALMIDVLCASLVEDASFAYRADLRLALAKIDHAFGALSAVRLDPTERTTDAPVRTLITCMVEDRFARVGYVDASGTESDRVFAPYGSFGLRDHTYIVGSCDDASGASQIRTLRADRIVRVRPLAKHFEVPADFAVEDHIVLPFQIGPAVGTALLTVGPSMERGALGELRRRGHAKQSQGVESYELPMASEYVCAAWCIAVGAVPLAPSSLVEHYRTTLEQAARATYMPLEVPTTEPKAPARGGRRGRPGASDRTRELLALVGSLSREGAVLTAEGVASRLGITTDRAHELLELLLTACSGTSYQLPLSLSEGDALVLARGRGVAGKPIRLTRTETHAVVAALETLGYDADDPLRTDVLSAFAAVPLSAEEASEYVAVALHEQDDAYSETLEACSWALTSGATLSFRYQGSADSEPRTRVATPRGVRHDRGAWYLDALDLEIEAPRTFRVDRMDEVRIRAQGAGVTCDVEDAPQDKPRRMVSIAFADPMLLEALEWPGLELLGERDGLTVVSLPYYGGTWLPRHLAACGDNVRIGDADLAAAVRSYAQSI